MVRITTRRVVAFAGVVALSVGAAGPVTRAVARGEHPVAAVSGWDAQKLQAMAGRELAAAVRRGVVPWDAQKRAAMAGREHAEAIRMDGSLTNETKGATR